jgi:hypothetical protein
MFQAEMEHANQKMEPLTTRGMPPIHGTNSSMATYNINQSINNMTLLVNFYEQYKFV